MGEVLEGLTGWEAVGYVFALHHHEAAHAVLAHHLGLRVEAVTVEQHGDTLRGNCEVRGDVPPWHSIQDTAMYLAGRYADWRCLHDEEDRPLIPFEEFANNTCGYFAQDTRYALESLGRAVEFNQQVGYSEEMLAELSRLDTLRGCYEAAAREARWAVEAHWPEICAVANALMGASDCGEPLTGEEVEEIIESVKAGREAK